MVSSPKRSGAAKARSASCVTGTPRMTHINRMQIRRTVPAMTNPGMHPESTGRIAHNEGE
jgi:hypothetical protein